MTAFIPGSSMAAQQAGVDPDLTLAFAQASLAAYNDYLGLPFSAPPNYRLYGRFYGWDDIVWDFGEVEKFGLIFKYCGPSMIANRFIVAFRGTDTDMDVFEDIFQDLVTFAPYRNAFPTPPNVASGYCGIYTGIGGNMSASMQQQIFQMLPSNPSEVIATGHSLGGALAQLFSLDFAVSVPNHRLRTVTFASPQVGDGTFQAACDQAAVTRKMTRVFNYFDFVPDYPSELGWAGYVSVGQAFQTAFRRQNEGIIPAVLSRHSLNNLTTVLSHCVRNDPQVWLGTFPDYYNTAALMQSLAPPSASKADLYSKLRAYREAEGAQAENR